MTDRAGRRRLQQSWEAVRSQLMLRIAHCDGPTQELPRTAAAVPLAIEVAAEPYYGPGRDARTAVNHILGLGPAAGQDEWEAELGRAGTMEKLVDALGGGSLDTEARSAIALLLLDAADRMPTRTGKELLTRIRWHLRLDGQVLARMRYWWTHMDGSAPVMEALS
jgi:hypothetical protein